MAPERIPLLLFVLLTSTSFSSITSLEELINVPENKTTRSEGSCVTIPCDYKEYNNKLKLLWFKDAVYNESEKKYIGTIVYSNKNEPPQSPDYSSRVKYITSQTGDRIQCALRITDLQKTDSGNYSFRFIDSDKEYKYMSKAMEITVTDNPCKVQIEPLELESPLTEKNEFTVQCSTSGSCDSHPEWLVHTSGQKQESMTLEDKEGRKVTKLKFNVTWKDDNRILSCHPANSTDNCQFRNITLSVEYAPKETRATVSSENIIAGNSVTLSCTSRGHPNPIFTWFKKEKTQMKEESNFQLHQIKPEDSGQYYCEAKNKHGELESNIVTIDVKYGPKGVNVQPLRDMTDLTEGDKLELKCSVEKSNPAVKQFKWYKNSQIQPITTDTFSIRQVKAKDEGSYQCQADNEVETSKSNKLQVSLKYSPSSIEIRGETSVRVGTGLTLTCSAKANPVPHLYEWTFSSGLSSLTFPKTAQLTIEEVSIQHTGQYTCAVTNTVGTRSQSTNVHVLYPPVNLTLIMRKEVREFEVISITCTVQSFPKSQLTVTGPKGDLRNIHHNRGNTTASPNKLVVYLNVTESDAGKYKCKAENPEGNNKTEEELSVLYAPKIVTVQSSGEQRFGSERTLTCEARSKPAPSYEWKKHDDGHVKTAGREQKLHFHSLEVSDSGRYICIASNSVGKAQSEPADIRVEYAPGINIVHNMTASTQWEFPVYLTCSADAYPPATVYNWYKQEDKKTTSLSNRQNFTVLPQNPGVYYCTAENKIGRSQSKQIMLFVSSNFKIFYQIILPIILLLCLIAVAIFLIRRTIIKARSDQQIGTNNPLWFFPVLQSRSSTVANLLLWGSRNNTQENLSGEEAGFGRVNPSDPTPHPTQDPIQTQGLNQRQEPYVHTVYDAIKLPQMKQKRHSPKQQKTGCTDSDLTSASLNYVTLDFKGQDEPAKRKPESSVVYTTVSKNRRVKNSQSEHPDYENVSSACAPKSLFLNMDWESDTSEEDEVNYSTVSKPTVPEPKQHLKSRLSSSSSDEEDRTVYSAIKK